MNTNEAIHNRNAETAPRLRYAEPMIPSMVYPFNYPIQQIFYPYNPSVIMAPNSHSQPPTINANDHSSNEQSGIMSPNSDISIVSQPPYRITSWQDIADGYEGKEDKPKCGKLKDNMYFTQRSASSDMFMVFDKKSDYINNFVNYYFSDKNLARDQKLVALMDDKGIVPLSALTKFPKLHQVDTTVEDLIKAFQFNSFVAAVDMSQINEKGAQRRDRMCVDINKNGIERTTTNSLLDVNHDLIGNNHQINTSSVVVSDNNIATMQIQNENVYPTQNTPIYFPIVPTIFTQQPGGIMPTPASSTINGFSPFIQCNMAAAAAAQFQYATHSSAGAPNSIGGIAPAQNHQHHQVYQNPLTIWPVSSSDYNNHHLISQMPYNHNNVVHGNANHPRFLSNSSSSSSATLNVGFNNNNNSVQTSPAAAASTTTEPAGSRIN